MKAEERRRASALFIEGMSIRKTAEAVGVSRSSVERWSREGRWYVRRVEARDEAIQKAKREFVALKVTRANLIADKLTTIFNAGFAEWIANREQNFKRKPSVSLGSLIRLADTIGKVAALEADALLLKQLAHKMEKCQDMPGEIHNPRQ